MELEGIEPSQLSWPSSGITKVAYQVQTQVQQFQRLAEVEVSEAGIFCVGPPGLGKCRVQCLVELCRYLFNFGGHLTAVIKPRICTLQTSKGRQVSWTGLKPIQCTRCTLSVGSARYRKPILIKEGGVWSGGLPVRRRNTQGPGVFGLWSLFILSHCAPGVKGVFLEQLEACSGNGTEGNRTPVHGIASPARHQSRPR